MKTQTDFTDEMLAAGKLAAKFFHSDDDDMLRLFYLSVRNMRMAGTVSEKPWFNERWTYDVPFQSLLTFYRAARALEPDQPDDTIEQAWRMNASFGNAALR